MEGKKRAREEEQQTIGSSSSASSSFTFGFFDNANSTNINDDDNGKVLAQHKKTTTKNMGVAPSSRILVRNATIADDEDTKSLHIGDDVYIMWEESSHFRIRVRRKADGYTTYVRPFQLMPPSATLGEGCLRGMHDTSLILHIDPVLDNTNNASMMAPPILDASLPSLIWPLDTSNFLKQIYDQGRAFCTQGVGARTSQIRKDLGGGGNSNQLQLSNILSQASKIVIWMKALDDGKMQYLDAPNADVALACYRAGHSLYFNPSEAVQRTYIRSILKGLGMDLSAGLEVGLGGDMEIFAVQGKHSTPFHFDAQDNFTIQLRGMKKWTLAKSGIKDPLTNCHPSSSNESAIRHDRATHAACGQPMVFPPGNQQQQQQAGDGNTASVILRPGSVLFVPAGMWHQVESLGDHDEGSLSINLSLDPCRWSDVMSRSLGPILWGGKESSSSSSSSESYWRRRACIIPSSSSAEQEDAMAQARDVVRGMLQSLKSRLEELEPEDLLPLSVFAGGRQVTRLIIQDDSAVTGAADEEEDEDEGEDSSSEEEEDDDKAAEARGRRDASRQARQGLTSIGVGVNDDIGGLSLVRSPLAALVIDNDDDDDSKSISKRPPSSSSSSSSSTIAYLHRAFGLEQSSAECEVSIEIQVPLFLRPLLIHLATLPSGQSFVLRDVMWMPAQGGGGGGGGGLAMAEEGANGHRYHPSQQAIIKKLVGILIFHGFLRRPASS